MNENMGKIKNKVSFAQFYSKFGVFVILAVCIVAASFLSPEFLSSRNLLNVIRQNSIVGIVAFGMQLVIIAGDIDLSPGSNVAFSGCIAAYVMVAANSIILAVIAAMISGAIIGLFNGFIVTKCSIPAFIMTMAMQLVIRGVTYLVTGATPISGMDQKFAFLGQGSIGPVPTPIVLLGIVFAVTWVLLYKTRYGRYLYAVGGNKEAAKSSGINVDWIRNKAFIYTGLLAGFAGVILMSRLMSGQPSSGEQLEFEAITAVVIGGTSMSGGSGNVWGTLAGALFVGVIINIMTLTNVNAYWQQIVRGTIIAVAVIIDVAVRKVKKAM